MNNTRKKLTGRISPILFPVLSVFLTLVLLMPTIPLEAAADTPAASASTLSTSVSAGYLWDWGNNTKYQLGDGSTTNQEKPQGLDADDIEDVVAVAGGLYHSLAVDEDGTVWAWGNNSKDQLGNEDADSSESSPLEVDDLEDIIAAAAGGDHNLALDDEGYVWAWGYNSTGQLGINSTSTKENAIKVKGGEQNESYLSNIEAIAAGYAFSLALDKDGHVWAWGDNSKGQLGNSSTSKQTTPIEVKTGEQNDNSTYLSNIVAIAAGYQFSLAVDEEGNIWSWGYNNYGQLGNADTNTEKTPVQVEDISNAIAVAAGQYHSLALTDEGKVYAWGYNKYGQLGNGDTDTEKTPVAVEDSDMDQEIESISAGYNHSLALDADGTVWSWGDNNYGQLGDGSDDNQEEPVEIEDIDGDVCFISAGANHSLAISDEEGESSSSTLKITTTTLKDATKKKSYSVKVTASGGSLPYEWKITDVDDDDYDVTDYLDIDSDDEEKYCTLSGTFTGKGTYDFTIKVTDDNDDTDTQDLSIDVTDSSDDEDVKISTASLANGTIGAAYSDTISASGGSGSYIWSKYSGELPDGLSINSSSGKISGTPAAAGDYTFTIKVKDSDDSSLTDTATFTVTISSTGSNSSNTTTEISGSTVSLSGGAADTPLKIDKQGITQNTSNITTSDNRTILSIPKGITMVDSSGNPITTISATQITAPLVTPDDTTLITAYAFGPSGANFSAVITCVFKFNQSDLPSGVSSGNLGVYYYNGTKWNTIDSQVDTGAGTVTAKISHFSVYALMAKTTQADIQSQISPTGNQPAPASNQSGHKVNWALLIGVIVGVLVVVVVLLVIIRRKNSY